MRDSDKTPQEDSPIPEGVESLTERLAEPFSEDEVKFKPAVVSGNRCLALPYVDARAIQDRLDEVLGVAGWQDEYECLSDGAVVCRLRLRLGDEWITKMDVGGQSEQPDEGDRRKAAFSDALKRAAVKFGIGRYLYRLEPQWVDYDTQKKKIVKPPKLPAPKKPAVRLPAHEEALPRGKEKALPANGVELQRRLYTYDNRLATEGLCRQGELVKHIVQAGIKVGYDPDLSTWSGPAIALAAEQTKVFESQCRQGKGHKEVA